MKEANYQWDIEEAIDCEALYEEVAQVIEKDKLGFGIYVKKRGWHLDEELYASYTKHRLDDMIRKYRARVPLKQYQKIWGRLIEFAKETCEEYADDYKAYLDEQQQELNREAHERATARMLEDLVLPLE